VLLPEKARVVLMGDRFYGAAALIGWCRDQGWGFRLRCRKDLLVFDEDSVRTTLATCFARGERMLTLGLALYWAVSTGMGKTPAEKKPGTPNAAASPAA
jgi:hypothetical protein